MTEKSSDSPVRVDLGAKVQANFEVKAEVPAASVGRLVDSLTDIFRPFSEARGLRADQIRLQREDVLIEIAKKARARIAIEGAHANSIPNKFLVPFMEKASLEDPTSELCEAWAHLLVEASKNFDPKLGLYVDILSKISGKDAKFLKGICFASRYDQGVSWPLGHFAQNENAIRSNLRILDQSRSPLPRQQAEAYQHWLRFKTETKLEYGYFVHAVVIHPGGSLYFYNQDFGAIDGITIDRLEGERLLQKKLITFHSAEDDNLTGTLSYVDLTYLAIDLVRVCTRSFSIR